MRFFQFILCCFVAGWLVHAPATLFAFEQDDEWEDEDEWEEEEEEDPYFKGKECWDDTVPNPWKDYVSYGGMIIRCPYGCGHWDHDPSMQAVKRLFAGTVNSAFCYRCVFNDPFAGSIHPFSPWWDARQGVVYATRNWATGDVIWKEGSPPVTFHSIASYEDFRNASLALLRDLRFFYLESPHLRMGELRRMLPTLIDACNRAHSWEYWRQELYMAGCGLYDPYDSLPRVIDSLKSKMQNFTECLSCAEATYEKQRHIVEDAIERIDSLFKAHFVWCLEQHQIEGVTFQSTLDSLVAHEFEQAFEQIQSLIDIADNHQLGDDLISKLRLLEGQVNAEFSRHAQAIVALTAAIQKNPSLKEAYFARAASYFETGDFDRAVDDYLRSGCKSASVSWDTASQMSAGITMGIAENVAITTLEFVPEVLNSVRGLGHGIWALSTDPVGASEAFVDAAVRCVHYLKTHSLVEITQDLVPELKELCTHYDTLGEFDKGKLIGQVIGRYGTDILLGKYSMEAVRAFQDLNRANQAMTLEALTSSKSATAVREAASRHFSHREEVLKNANLTLHEGRQGKHIEGHPNYKERLKKEEHPSIFQHPEPERLIRKYAGTGVKSKGEVAGTPGYKEIVNFEEFIGYVVEEKTGSKTATTWEKFTMPRTEFILYQRLRGEGPENGGKRMAADL